MNEDNRFLYYVDENGQRRDDAIHEPFLNDPERHTVFHLLVIRDYVDDGNSLDDAVELFGTDVIRDAHQEGQLSEILSSLWLDRGRGAKRSTHHLPIVRRR